jgi:hypothetical protein
MTLSNLRARLEELLAGDQALYAQLCEAGLVPRQDEELALDHLETARVVRTLVHELEINWAGVEVVLHMRTELLATRRQLAELAELLRRLQERNGDSSPQRK